MLERKGWIQKEGGQKGSWKTRFMTTDPEGLAYYKKEDMKNKCGVIDIKNATDIRLVDHKKKQNVFEIVCPDRVWVISCPRPAERDGWLQTINRIVQTHKPKLNVVERKRFNSAIVPEQNAPMGATRVGVGRHGSVSLTAQEEDSFQSFQRNMVMKTSGLQRIPSPRARGSLQQGPPLSPRSQQALNSDDLKAKAHEAKDKILNIKGNLERAAIKRGAYLAGVSVAKLYVTVLSVQFSKEMDTNLKPMVEAYFERQAIESAVSKNPTNPHWKDNFLFEVASIESRLKIKIYDKEKQKGAHLAFVNIPIKHLEDKKQHKQWFDLQGEFAGKINISWRLEFLSEKNEEDNMFSTEDILGTASLSLIGAKNLTNRGSGAPPNPRAVITYGKSEYTSSTLQDTSSPDWNYGCILRVRKNDSSPCTIRIEDMDKVQHTHLGTWTITRAMLLEAKSEEPKDYWVKLELDSVDDPNDNMVGGELHYRLRFKHYDHMNKLVTERIEELISTKNENAVDFDDIPDGFPEPPPVVPTQFLGTTKEEYSEWMKLKLLRQTWENALTIYRKKEQLGDTQGMQSAIETYRKERKSAFPDAIGIRKGGAVVVGGTRKKEPSTKPSDNPFDDTEASSSPAPAPSPSAERTSSPAIPEIPQQTPPKMEMPKVEPIKTEPARPEPAKAVPTQPETTKPEPNKAIPEPAKTTKTELPKPEPTQTEQKPEPTKTTKTELPKPEPIKTEPTKPKPQNNTPEPIVHERSATRTYARSIVPQLVPEEPANPFEDSKPVEDGNPFGDAPDNANPFEDAPPASTSDVEDWFSVQKALTHDVVPDVIYKVIIIGASGVGKTNLLWRWMDNTFTQKSATINVEFAVKTFKVKDKYVKIQMWDTAGQEQYRAVTRSYYRSAKGAILVYDTTKADTFHNLNTWVKDVLDVPGNEDTQILLIGNKIDLVDQRDVKTEDGKQFAVEHGMNFMETSALTGTNVDLAFKILLTDIHKLHFKDLENSGPSTSNNNPSAGIVLTPQAPVSEDCCEGSIDSQIDTLKSFASSFFN